MRPVTIAEAARLTRTSKSTIQRAVKSHELSATRDDQDRWMIDPAELSRVYEVHLDAPLAQSGASENTDAPSHQTTPKPNHDAIQLNHAKEKLEIQYQAEKDKTDLLQSQVHDLQSRLDRSEEERIKQSAQITSLLTHQPEPDTTPTATPESVTVRHIEPKATPAASEQNRSWFAKVFL